MSELEIFTAALRFSDPAERSAFLDQACAGKPELRERIERLLIGHQFSRGPLDRSPFDLPATEGHRSKEEAAEATLPASHTAPATDSTPTVSETVDLDAATTASAEVLPKPAVRLPDDKNIGTVIAGRYTLIEVIGRGGMGSVYRAGQTQPVKREVALKLIKTGMDSRDVLARFDAERQALALMDHPNIARIYDGGVTTDGRPFFVMELVDGVPLTEYCDRKRMTVEQRLELFVSVCQAVQHAHQKGIIHRDLKPSNVLVAEVDGRPTPKVIDFGVAKATERKLTDMSFADTGAIVGTPMYMSPEQADPTSRDIDTRTDVYALGVMLYELLTGSPPIDAGQFQRGAILEMLRMVREVEPHRPSTRLSDANARPNIAANRSIEPTKLTKLLQGELDWVVMKALEKDRTRRYETANSFARDIQRYLADEVVEARPPSRGYRIRKFVKRNKVQVVAASLVLVTLVAGVVGTTVGLIEAKRQERKALAAADEERKAKREAETEKTNALKAAEAERVAKLDADARREEAVRNLGFARKGNELLGSVFAGLDPKKIVESGRPLQDVLRENLVKAVKELEGAAIGDPLEVAAIQNTLGRSLLSLGEANLAVEVLEKSRDTRKAKLGPEHPETLQAMNDLAVCYSNAGQLGKALPLHEETLKLMKAKFGSDNPYTLRSMNNLAGGYRDSGRLDMALPLFEETVTLTKAKLGPDHPDTLLAMNNLALNYRDAGQFDKAQPLIEETLLLSKAKLGPDHPDTLSYLFSLASIYQAVRRLDKAVPLLEETLELRKAKLGPDHPDTLESMSGLASVYTAARQMDKALPLHEEALKLAKGRLGPEHPFTLNTMNNLAACYWRLKQLNKSVPIFEELVPLQEKKLGRTHPNTLGTIANLGVNYKDAGRVAEAIPLLEEAYRASVKIPTLRWVGPALFDAHVKAGKPAKARKLFDEILSEARKTLPKDSPQLAGQLAQFSLVLLEMKGYAEAEPLIREALDIREKTQPDMWNTFRARAMLGWSLLGQEKYAEAEPLLLEGYEGMKSREKTIPPIAGTRIPEALDRLVELYTATDNPAEVKKYQELRSKYPTPNVAAPPPGEKK
ncbi:MAG: tetratricopeptide repeat protein [Isosphaeraceae bacterium]|nr:tetratricopeptide repeat protein [Isosphaeraceae bacterium]